MYKTDENDLKILDALKENSRLSMRKIARKTLIPVATVYNRIKKMEEAGIIEGYTIKINQKKLGKLLTSYIQTNYDISQWRKESKEKQRKDLKKELLSLSGIESISYITGRFDILLKVRVKDMDELNNLILTQLRNIPGIGASESFFVLEEIK